MIQLNDGNILLGNYNNKKVVFYDYNFKVLNEITTP